MKKIILLSLILFTACNNAPGGKGLTSGGGKDTTACPNYLPMDRQEFELTFSQTSTSPKNISVIYNGIEKFNGCDNFVSSDIPILHAQVSATIPIISIKVFHLGAFQDLPNSASLEINDLKDCVLQKTRLYKDQNIPLNFTSKTVGPKECRIVEHVNITTVKVN